MHNAESSKSRDRQQISHGPKLCLVAIAAVWGGVTAWQSLHESLWIDELHSVWSASGSFGEIPGRAHLGNQLSPYFCMLWILGQTFGNSEAVWRAPSLVAWLLGIVSVGWWLRRQSGWFLLLILATIVFDRSQLFYATEARPYALVALFVTWSWLALATWSEAWLPTECQPHRFKAAPCLAWCLFNSAAFWLQPISLIAIFPQFVFLGCLGIHGVLKSKRNLNTQPRISQVWPAMLNAMLNAVWPAVWPAVVGAALLTGSMVPAVQALTPVWDNRHQWAAFASGCSLKDVLQLLPATAFALPMILAFGLARIAKTPKTVQQDSGKQYALGQRRWWMWLLAWSLPCLIVWLSTVSGVAPLMHRRYVYSAAFPLVLWYATSNSRLPGPALQKWTVVATLLILTWQQGSWQQWQAGRWHSALRGEHWREAMEWIQSQHSAGQHSAGQHSAGQHSAGQPIVIFCACNLIEGARPIEHLGASPAEMALDQYLTLPGQSIYTIAVPSRFVPLENDPRRWRATIQATLDATPTLKPTDCWLLVRTSAAGLERSMVAGNLKGGPRGDFGGVQVVRQVGFKESP